MIRGSGLAAANHVDEAVVQQRKQRRQLRHDGVIVVARIGNQRFGKGNAMACDAAVDPGDILGRGSRDVAERTAGLDAFPVQRMRPSRSLVRRSSFGASCA